MTMEKLINQFPGGMFFRYLKGKELQFTGELVQSCKMFSCGTGDWETFKVIFQVYSGHAVRLLAFDVDL